MADKQKAEALIGDLGKLVGIPNLAFDRDGRCRLAVDEAVELELSYVDGEGCLVVAAPLGPIPEDAPPGLLLALLDANFFWRGTEGATIGVDRGTRVAVLMDVLPLDGLHAGRLEARLGTIVGVALDWMDRIRRGEPAAEAVTRETTPAADEFILRL